MAGDQQARAVGAEDNVSYRRLCPILCTSRSPPSVTCQSDAMPSPAPMATFRPSGLNAMQNISVPSRTSRPNRFPLSASQRQTVPLNPPETMRRPSGLNRASRSGDW